MTKITWYIAGVFVLAAATVFSWLAFDLSRRDKDIAKLRGETERLGAEVARAAVDRDVALAKCRVLESAIVNARKRETVTTSTGRETTVTVSPTGETITHTVEPATSSTEIISEPTVPGNPDVNTTATGDASRSTVNAPNTLPAAAPFRGMCNTLSLIYETDGALGILYQRDVRRWRLGVGFNFRQRGILAAGYTF